MAEIFESEKQKIREEVRRLFRLSCSDLCRKMPKISQDQYENIMAIYWEFSLKNTEEFRREIGNCAALFPAFLGTLNGYFTEERVRYLTEVVLSEAKNFRINAEKRPT